MSRLTYLPGRIRTYDLMVRSHALYPTGLRAEGLLCYHTGSTPAGGSLPLGYLTRLRPAGGAIIKAMTGEDNQIPGPEPEGEGAPGFPDPGPPSPEEQVAVEQMARVRRWFHFGYEPRITRCLVGANIGVFLAMVASSGLQSLFSPSIETMLSWGALFGPEALYGQYWRMLTSLFLHAGLIHLVLNMYVLWFAGRIVEGVYGSIKFLALYLVAGLGGSLGMIVFSPLAVGVGASGAVFGVFGALVAFLQVRRGEFPPRFLAERFKGLMVFLFIGLAFGFTVPGIGNAAHIGGLICGYLAGLCVMPADPRDLRWHWKDSLRIAAMLLAIALVIHVEKRGMLDFTGDLMLARGMKMLDDHRYSDAVRYFNKCITRNPEDLRAHLGRAMAFAAQDKYRQAVEDCDKILSLDRKNVRALLTRAVCYGKVGEHEKSRSDLTRALSLDPAHPGAYALRGWDNMVLGDYQQSIDDYTKAMSNSRNAMQMHYSRGCARFAAGDRRGAVEDERRFLREAGWGEELAPYAVIILALSYRSLDKPEEASKILDEGAAHLKHAAWPYPVIEYLRREITADQLLARATDNGKMTEVQTYLGLDLLQQGKGEEASRCFKWVVEHGNKEFYEYPIARSQAEQKEVQ